MRSIRVKMLLVCLSALLPTGLSAAGSELYADNCAGCHGDAGEGNADLLAPVLAGQDGTYLSRQIENFRSGLRRVSETNDSALGMTDILTTMADADIAEVSQYLSGLPLPGLEQETPPPGFRGRGLYSGCLSCHGARAEGNPNLNAPRLSGQYAFYLTAQIIGFREGLRGTHPEDEPGRQMKEMADAIADESDIEEIVAYIAAQEP